MLTIIFGAGASYDSSPDHLIGIDDASRPPLAKELFSKRFAHIASDFLIALPLINRLRRASNIEHELEIISTERGSNIPEQLLKTRRYIKQVIEQSQVDWEDIIHRNTVYYEFIDVLQKWQEDAKVPINLITFNYDTLLDIAYSTLFKVPLRDLDSYVFNDTSCKLFKPHGSINWVHLAQKPHGNPVYGDVDHLIKQLAWTPDFMLLSESGILRPGYYKFPAISVPTETKDMFEFPRSHKAEMEKAINDTTCLLSIGWKGEEKHFLKLWGTPENKKKLGKIEIVNSNPNLENVNKIIRNITRYGNIVSQNISSYSGGFSNYVPDVFSDFLNKS